LALLLKSCAMPLAMTPSDSSLRAPINWSSIFSRCMILRARLLGGTVQFGCALLDTHLQLLVQSLGVPFGGPQVLHKITVFKLQARYHYRHITAAHRVNASAASRVLCSPVPYHFRHCSCISREAGH